MVLVRMAGALKATLKKFRFYNEGSRNPLECFKQKSDSIRYGGCQHVQLGLTNIYEVPAMCLALAR